jgi:hypothetical protein
MNEITNLANSWLNSWKTIPLVQKRPTQITRVGVLKDGVTQKDVDVLFTRMMDLLLPKLRKSICKNLDTYYKMDEALQDSRERIYFYILATWKQDVQPNFEKQACLSCDTWTRTVVRNIRCRLKKETSEEETPALINVAVKELEDLDAYLLKLPTDTREIAEFVADNYTLSKRALCKAAVEEFGFTKKDFELALTKISTHLKGVVV